MYHAKVVFATARRILQQLSHDHRTVALIFIVPSMLLSILRWLYVDDDATFNHIAPAMLAIFPFSMMFVVTSITTLRERIGGTMERLMTLPIAKLDLVLGYMFAFSTLAVLQAALTSYVLVGLLGLDIQGPVWFLIMMALADALLGTALGIFISVFARTEFQAVQFLPALIIPQILIGGLLLPLDQMPDLLERIAYCLPLTYAIDALNTLRTNVDIIGDAWRDLWVVLAFAIGALLLGSLTLRRRTK